MTQRAIPYLFMRGGTSRGPYFRREDLPEDRERLGRVLLAAVGSGHPLCIDGVGGSATVTTKVAMLSPSKDDWADVDYFFAQLGVEEKSVDFKPTCGNILAGVGPAAIEMGLVAAKGDVTEVKIHAVNTGARVLATIQTPGGALTYEGSTAIDGVPGTAASIGLGFMGVAGSATGALLPTGALKDVVDGIEVSCFDVAMPTVVARAQDFGVTGYEAPEALSADAELMAKVEAIRLEAGRRMGMGDVSGSVIPKFALIAAPRQGGTIAARYFTPKTAHPAMAVTGGQCIASCAMAEGSVADGVAVRPEGAPVDVVLEHGSGVMGVLLDYRQDANGFDVVSAGLERTARKLAAGEVFTPATAWD